MAKITVLFPIEVPEGKYCWEPDIDGSVPCQYLDWDYKRGGQCRLGFFITQEDGGGDVNKIFKSFTCSRLEVAPAKKC